MASSQHRCVFVGNIPYDVTEEQLIEICQEVGPVVSFRLVTDRETGKPKGYGFCEYKDEETALSARRNLQGYEINGRQLRVDFAENDKGSDRSREQSSRASIPESWNSSSDTDSWRYKELAPSSFNNIDYSVVNSDAILGRGGPGLATNADHQKQAAAVVHGDAASSRPIGLQTATAAAAVMTGAIGGPQVGSSLNQNGFQSQSTPSWDPLTLHLANMTRNQLNEVLSELKGFATRKKESAQQLLNSRPQLAKALFQAEIMLGMVTPQVLQMPNLRKPAQTAIVESQVMQQAAISASSRLSPHAHRLDSAALTDIHGQMPTVAQGSFVPSQFSRPSQPPVQQQFQLIPHRNFQQGQISGVNIGETSQKGLASKPVITSLLPHPSGIDPHFQTGPSGVSDGLCNNAGLGQVTLDASISRSNQYATTNVGFLNQSSRPSKLIKLEDGRGSSLSVRGVDGNAGTVPSQFGMTQAVPDADTSLLQQVLSLTAEQLSTLPPEQRQQVLQLQQKLRQDHQIIAD